MMLLWSHQRFCVEKFELFNTAEVSQKMQGCVCVCVCVCVCGGGWSEESAGVSHYESSEQQTYTQTHLRALLL